MLSSPHRILGLTLLALTVPCTAQQLQQRPPAVPAQPLAAPQQSPSAALALPSGTSLQVETLRRYPMRAGESIEGRLMHPLYANGKLVVAEGTQLHGTVVELEPDSGLRWRSRLHGDFTPFHTPRVRFDQLELPGGAQSIATSAVADGAPVLHLTTPGAAPHRSLIARQWAQARGRALDQFAFFTAPGKGERMLQLLYRQLPWHPERIAAHTAWSFELTAPLELPGAEAATTPPPAPAPLTGSAETWSVHALLLSELTSARAHPGDPVHALVVEPVYDRDRKLVVPQGATLVGKVTASRAARSLGRNGRLRFTFQQVQFPEGYNQPVQGSLAGAATQQTQNLSLDAEGTITPRNQASAIAPLLLSLLASRALDEDGNVYANNTVASNGFGLVGRIVGITAANRNLAAGLGGYAAALSFYENFLHNGRDVVFPKDTRIEIETTPLRAPVLTPAAQ